MALLYLHSHYLLHTGWKTVLVVAHKPYKIYVPASPLLLMSSHTLCSTPSSLLDISQLCSLYFRHSVFPSLWNFSPSTCRINFCPSLLPSFSLWPTSGMKPTWEGKGFFPFIGYSHLMREAKARTQCRGLKQKPQRTLMTEGLSTSCSATSYKAQTHLPRDGTVHSVLGPPTLISN